MRVSVIQSALHWENPEQNRAMFAQKIEVLRGQTDLIVLPEMFSTGFSMNAQPLAETMGGTTHVWMQEQAKQSGAAIVGSFNCLEDGHCYNRLVFMRPDGEFSYYDKKHLFSLAGEKEHYQPGAKKLILTWQGWRICPMICYDLRFPVWCRNVPSDPYDLLIFVANWPQRRTAHWQALLTARSIENQCFTIGANIFGQDGNGLEYSGDSAIIDYSGQALCRISGQEGTYTAELNKGALTQYRQQLPFLSDADHFELL